MLMAQRAGGGSGGEAAHKEKDSESKDGSSEEGVQEADMEFPGDRRGEGDGTGTWKKIDDVRGNSEEINEFTRIEMQRLEKEIEDLRAVQDGKTERVDVLELELEGLK